MPSEIAPVHSGKIALRTGIGIGILLGIIHSIITIISTIQNTGQTSNATFLNTLLYLVTPLIWIIGLLFTGTWASRFTGKVGTGTLAGLFAGLFGGIIASFGQAIASAIGVNLAPAPTPSGLVLLTGFATIFYIMILTLGAGAGCGALGGLIGQAVSDVRPPAPVQPIPVQPIPVQQIPVYQPPAVPYGYAPQQPQYQQLQQIHTPTPAPLPPRAE